MKPNPLVSSSRTDSVLTLIAVTIIIQCVAAIFFLGDAITDILYGMDSVGDMHRGIELLIAIALVSGVMLGIWLYRRMLFEAREREAVVLIARGALSDLLDIRFAEWRLTSAEREVAMFAIKGCDVSEIARMRSSAPSTVRAQLSRVYHKAGVSGQSMLIGMLVDDLLDLAAEPATHPV